MIFPGVIVVSKLLAELLAQFVPMRIRLYLIFLLWIPSGLYAQKAMDFEEKLRVVEGLTYDVSSFDSAYAIADDMLKMARTDLEKGLANFAKAEVIVKNGWGYYLGEYGVPYIEDAINYLAEAGRRDLLSDVFSTLSISYITKYNPNNEITSARELEYLRTALRLRNDPSFKLTLPFKANLEDHNTTSGDILPTIKAVSEDLEISRQKGNRHGLMYRTEKLGYLYWQLDNNLSRAEPFLRNAMELAKELNSEYFKSICLGQLAVYANKSGDYNKALNYAMEGLNHCQNQQFPFRETIFRDQLYQTYLALGNEKEALHHRSASLNTSERVQQLSYYKRHKMVMDRIREMEYRKELEAELKQKTHRLTLITSGIVALLLITLLAIFANLRLRNKNKEILEASLVGQSTERRRVAADLHDNLGSTLSSIRWSLDAIDQSTLSHDQQNVFGSLKENLEKAYSDVRLLAHNLLPVALEEHGLCEALKLLTQKLNKNGKTQFSIMCNPDFPRIHKKLEFELYSICLELYSNILKHSQAEKSETSLSIESDKIELKVSDNGIGYESDNQPGMGLKNIQDRVNSIQGQWFVNSLSHSAGTENVFHIPVR